MCMQPSDLRERTTRVAHRFSHVLDGCCDTVCQVFKLPHFFVLGFVRPRGSSERIFFDKRRQIGAPKHLQRLEVAGLCPDKRMSVRACVHVGTRAHLWGQCPGAHVPDPCACACACAQATTCTRLARQRATHPFLHVQKVNLRLLWFAFLHQFRGHKLFFDDD